MEDRYISNYVQNIEISGIRRFFNKVSKYPEAISLTLGQPDFNVPEKIKKAMIKAIEENKTGYTSNMGIVELRKEISNYLKQFHINFDDEEICLTVGGSEGLFNTFMALLNPGDKVLIPSPGYPAYESCTKLLGAIPINYKLDKNFNLDIEEIERKIKEENPKLLVLSFPSNPTGATLSKKDRDDIYRIIKDKDITVISDEIYSALVFEENYYSICQYEDIKDKVILISGFSKMFSMTGLRIGYVCAKEKYMKHIVKLHQYNTSCAPSIVQWAVVEGLKNCMEDVEYMKNEFIKRRDYVYKRLKDLNFDVNLPKGAFYIFPSIKKFNITSEKFCESLLKEEKVAVVPGASFGEGGEGYIRISYAYSMKELKEALDRIEMWIKKNV
ncbi:aminotransferase [Clostridium tetanomorphum]|uniref:pyridoxal phosphate-dependent aminotransferase n=1 Tax=Clostridium tetanomorphum TaxID=1553 RepID=UPI00044DA9D3|nr:aminotransferase class I/II-fold pyridoxal phosphate-dependent enzyme [Clostridium tetanomorphum]KAJ50447.1 class I/II aminotransferase [Clostridium tetanomorphum DSM 665]MBP1865645.1 aminotransferase [Clostridium tetanomorphum]NRS85849.1 aminotransferase [Clostridium tetanomorphum]SQB89953.1 aminotransferase, classes I and II [Clostridium tetanomorphum]